MSWLFSRALVAEYSAASCSGGEPSAPLNVMPTPHRFSRHDKTMDHSQLSRFGLTCAVLTEDHGAALLTSYLADFRARTSQMPAMAQELLGGKEVDYGWRWPESFARFDPSTHSWRTRQRSLLGGWTLFSETWPKWGSMRNGECSAHAPRERHIHARGCSWWPTPVATDHRRGKGSKAHRLENGRAVVDRPSKGRFGATLVDILGGTPNPTLIEWLMGWPTNWTALSPLATDRFRLWQQQHGGF